MVVRVLPLVLECPLRHGQQFKQKEPENHLFFLPLLLPVVGVVVDMTKVMLLREDLVAEVELEVADPLEEMVEMEIFPQFLHP
jgi:hypothetical protein